MRVLNVGCGRKTWAPADLFRYCGLNLNADDAEVVHLDADPALKPDILCTLGRDPIPAWDDTFDVIVAWHVFEHIGVQGETDEWFFAWEELYRVLKPKGWLYGESPYYSGIWAWSDPTHTRAMSEHSFVFFAQDSYRIPSSAISPYRVKCDFGWLGLHNLESGYKVITDMKDPRNTVIRFCLTALKPLAPWWADA